MNNFVYILKDKEDKTYIGMTSDLERRLKEHNEGNSQYTKRSAGEWTLEWYCNFKSRQQAAEFEKYLKTGSGIAFYRKRFL